MESKGSASRSVEKTTRYVILIASVVLAVMIVRIHRCTNIRCFITGILCCYHRPGISSYHLNGNAHLYLVNGTSNSCNDAR